MSQLTRADYVRRAAFALDNAPSEDYELVYATRAAAYALLAALPICPRVVLTEGESLQHPPCRLFEGHDGGCQS